jgi:protein-S-isoprenylcysteine O-methyltransferase Ste14
VQNSGRAATPTAHLFAWMGATVFVLSLSYFLFTFWTVFGRILDGPPGVAAILWNVLLFSAFALHHSVFAREPVRHRLTRAFPHLERSIYVWIASLLFIGVCWLWEPVGGTVWNFDGFAGIALNMLHVGGIALSVYSAALIDAFELAGVRQPVSRLLEFKTSGPYGLVRHPIYLGWVLIVFSVGTMTMTRFVFAVVSCAYILVAIPFEERSIRLSSAGAYDRYMKQVRRKLIPGLY